MAKTVFTILRYAIPAVAIALLIYSVKTKLHEQDGKSSAYHTLFLISVVGTMTVIMVSDTIYMLRTGQVPASQKDDYINLISAYVCSATCEAAVVGMNYFNVSSTKSENRK